MADISMCRGTNCPLKENCYRFTATPSPYRQSYLLNPPIKPSANGLLECSMYWPNEEKADEIAAGRETDRDYGDGDRD